MIIADYHLKGLKGSVETYHSDVRKLKRPYIAISEDEYSQLESGDHDYYLMADNRVVTFGTADGGWALMPLDSNSAREVLELNGVNPL